MLGGAAAGKTRKTIQLRGLIVAGNNAAHLISEHLILQRVASSSAAKLANVEVRPERGRRLAVFAGTHEAATK